MWRMFWAELCDAGWAFYGAMTTLGAILFGKRSHGGKVITFASRRWFPGNM